MSYAATSLCRAMLERSPSYALLQHYRIWVWHTQPSKHLCFTGWQLHWCESETTDNRKYLLSIKINKFAHTMLYYLDINIGDQLCSGSLQWFNRGVYSDKKRYLQQKNPQTNKQKKQKILRNIRSSVIADNCYAKSALAALLNSILKLFSRHWAV